MVQIVGNARHLISPALAGILPGFADIRRILLIVRNGGIMALVVILASVSAAVLLIGSVIIGVFGIQKRQADVLLRVSIPHELQ